MKRLVTIQDISAVGKCSLTVALPIISAMGVECAVLPTAVLSTHTMFKGFTCRDLTDEIRPISEHWAREGIRFDAIYTGYLGSDEQVGLMEEFFARFGGGAAVIVDPAMADNGKMYPAFKPAFAKRMAALCAKADLILPNLTEACFMLDKEYREEYDEAYIKEILVCLTALGAKTAALTGVSFERDRIGAMSYDSRTGEFFSYFNEKIPVSFHGTGDIFSSTVAGGLMNGLGTEEALKVAVDYTLECIRLTVADEEHNWYGVNFEQATPYLIGRLEETKKGRG